MLRNSVQKGPRFSSGQFTSPCVQPFGPYTHPYSNESRVPPLRLQESNYFTLAQAFANFSKMHMKHLIQKWKKGGHWVWTGEKKGGH